MKFEEELKPYIIKLSNKTKDGFSIQEIRMSMIKDFPDITILQIDEILNKLESEGHVAITKNNRILLIPKNKFIL